LNAESNATDYRREWAYAYGKPSLQARFKSQAEDFKVAECLPFELSGDGQHVYLRIRKTDLNTTDVARMLQRFCHIKSRAIGYAGLKDKRAVSEQWFSVDLADCAESPDWSQWPHPQAQILDIQRHRKRLKIGWVKSNRFDIVLRQPKGDRKDWQARLDLIASNALPNYFGEQRFGRDFANIAKSVEMLLSYDASVKQKNLVAGKRGFHYSVIRSFLFNEILSSRVAAGNWQQALAGEILILDGSQSFFQAQADDQDIDGRIRQFDIHPSAALPGREKARGDKAFRQDQAQHWEQQLLRPYREWIDALAEQGVEAARRQLRIKAQHFEWRWLDSEDLNISFELPSGVYATSVLRELLLIDDAMRDVIGAGEV